MPTNNDPGHNIHVIAKPIGALCNLRCDYCYYLDKQGLYPREKTFIMADDVLVTFIEQYIDARAGGQAEFVWQGGEPTLLGIDYFRKILKYQKRSSGSNKIRNSLQTNGTMLDDEWCNFLKKNGFLVGISLDGPEELHNAHRKDVSGAGSFDKAMKGLRSLKKHRVDYNILACVTKETAKAPKDVYKYFKDQGIEYLQFTPVVERDGKGNVTPWSVGPDEFGDFMIGVFDEWIGNDVGKIFVMNYEWALNAWSGRQSPVCMFAQECGGSLVIEHNGDVYSCDHFVSKSHLLGNIMETKLPDLARLRQQKAFGEIKNTGLTKYCRSCRYLFACGGECPKNRFAKAPSGENDLNCLCGGYRKYFSHINKYMTEMARLINLGRPASMIMEAVKHPVALQIDKAGTINL